MSQAATVSNGTEPGGLADLPALLARDLAPHVERIDEGVYPEGLMRGLGALGAWRQAEARGEATDLWGAIDTTATIGTVCGATAFMAWCQNTLVWYVGNSGNAALRERWLEPVASGAQLGGTGLSNPMKSVFGIETLKLHATPAPDGYAVRGALPWVSNLGPDHLFGTIAARRGQDGASAEGASADSAVMILADCRDPALRLTPCAPFLGMDGTGTYALQFRDLPVPDDMVLADPAAPFVQKIRAGFILLQTGMGLGLIRDCTAIMREMRGPLGAINAFLDVQPEDIARELETLESEIRTLAATPFETGLPYWRRVVAARLAVSELSLKAAQAAMLHCGARGYVKAHRAQRRVREAFFVAIVTPATKQLRKMLALADEAMAGPA